MERHPGHDLTKVSILHNLKMLTTLKSMVTIEPTPGILEAPTGIPPHIEIAIQIKHILDLLRDIVTSFDSQTSKLVETVEKAIDTKSWDSGHITGTQLQEILQQYKDDNKTKINDQLATIHDRLDATVGVNGGGEGGPMTKKAQHK